MSKSEASWLKHCTERQLRTLLQLAAGQPETSLGWLLEVGEVGTIQAILDQICKGSDQTGGALLGAVLSAETSVDALRAAKNAAKALAANVKQPAHKAAAHMLYHSALAAATWRHGQSITTQNNDERLALYQKLAARLTDKTLARIFEGAASRLKKS